ncbi:MAG: SEC-C metal-binding domain-containing protein [Deltaproteobacteria bacterium]|nr:SEC-C metal-binding domain-containing protein [Deltaproteobacteria bacterium]
MKRKHIDKRLDHRATPAAAERGFALLRDRAALVGLIESLTTTRPELASADRLAFALGPGDVVPHAVIARDGGGVTCLGPGMAFAQPVVPWPVVEGFLREQAQRLQATRALQSVKDVDDDVSPLIRLIDHPHRLVRREWDVLRALLPLIGVQMFTRIVLTAIDKVIAPVVAHRSIAAPAAAEMWRLYASAAIAMTLVGDQRGVTLMHLSALLSGDLILAARACWYLGNTPAETLAFADDVAARGTGEGAVPFERGHEGLVRAALSFVLPAVGYRCPAYFKEAERLAARLVDADEGLPIEASSRRAVDTATVSTLPMLLQPFCLNYDALIEDESVSDRVGAAGDVAAMAAAAGPWHVDVMRIWRPFADARAAPRLVPRPPGSATDDDDARLRMWRSLLRHVLQPVIVQPFLARLVTLAPIEALLPTDVPDPEWRLSEGALYVREKLELVVRPEGQRVDEPAHEPARAAKKPEPNGPCPCGSGKKFKKCHGKA